MDYRVGRDRGSTGGTLCGTLSTCLVALILGSGSVAAAQSADSYQVPRTSDGHPDFQGVWGIASLTTLERPPGIEALVAPPELAQALVEKIQAQIPTVVDPDVLDYGIDQLVAVNGEYRTSIIVSPEDGQMPLTEAGAHLAATITARNEGLYDHVGDRPLVERCMEALAYPPIRTVPVFLPRQIFQTGDYVVILAEDAVGRRMVPLAREVPPAVVRSVEGYSLGRWDGDTLVITTTNFRAEDPARNVLGRPLVLSPDTIITERFTRVSDGELFYRFTVADASLYSEPWSGELSLTRHPGPIYEYACHEGNYSLPNTLLGGRASGIPAAPVDRDGGTGSTGPRP